MFDELTANQNELIGQAIKFALEYEGIDYSKVEVSIDLATNEEIHALNKKFRKIDSATDVLSFPQYETYEQIQHEINNLKNGLVQLGDIVISLPKAKEQAELYGHSLERELVFLTVHSILHLLGYDHADNAQEYEMFSKQDEILEKMQL